MSSTRHNLPAQLTSFVGRERELAEVTQLLAGTRLLTLIGVGGCGKTRLALQVAREVLRDYPHGVWLVELASLSDPDLVPHAVASALGVAEQPGRSPTESLVRYLKPRTVLLLVDNCEQLVSGCALLVDTLLRSCPDLRVLATSREGLRITGEVTYLVPSLSLPDPHAQLAVESVMQSGAVRLFAERASLHRPGFSITDENAAAVVRVCRRLDGMPLAIELAAARIRALTVEQIASRLDDRFRLLTGGSRAALPRHQTLRAAMDWSYDLLSEPEQGLWRRVSVFAGGWTVEAAESICPGECVEATDVLDLLMRLVDKSLVVVDVHSREARYRLSGTVRQYGRNRLWDSGESVGVQDRHLDWYLHLAERAEVELRGPGQEAWLDRLEIERDNLRQALEWSRAKGGGAEAELRLAGALRWFWFIRGHWSEGRAWLERALTRKSEAPGSETRALLGAAMLARFQGDLQQARALCEDGLAMSRTLGDKESVAWFLVWLGALELRGGDYGRAALLFEESLIPSRELGDKWLISTVLADLGVVARIQGDLARADSLFTESLILSREAGDTWRVAMSLHGMGKVAFRRGDYMGAAKLYTESLALSKQVRDKWIADDCLEGLAAVACFQGRYRQASRLLGAADALREMLGYHPLAAEFADHDACVVAAQTHLGESAFGAAWAEGRAMTPEQAIEVALAPDAGRMTGATAAAIPRAGADADPLTPREREVAVLIADGKTNREIAALLVIAERTADTHVQHILNKLGVRSRAQIAAWAVDHGLRTAPQD